MTNPTTEGSIHAKWLRQAAAEIEGEGYDGWSKTCLQAADEIERLDREYLGALERLGVLQVQAGIRQQGVVYTKADVESLIAVALAADRARRSPEPIGPARTAAGHMGSLGISEANAGSTPAGPASPPEPRAQWIAGEDREPTKAEFDAGIIFGIYWPEGRFDAVTWGGIDHNESYSLFLQHLRCFIPPKSSGTGYWCNTADIAPSPPTKEEKQ